MTQALPVQVTHTTPRINQFFTFIVCHRVNPSGHDDTDLLLMTLVRRHEKRNHDSRAALYVQSWQALIPLWIRDAKIPENLSQQL